MQESIDNKKDVKVLMIEDNSMDAILATEILSESSRKLYEIFTVPDGPEAFEFLRRMNALKNGFLPDVILLDLNLPRMHGFEILKRIKADPDLRPIPVCILTTSSEKKDIESAKKLQADCYITKPLDLESFEALLSNRK